MSTTLTTLTLLQASDVERTSPATQATDAAQTLQITNDSDVTTQLEALLQSRDINQITRIDLAFPKFTDGRAFSQAVQLRRRHGYSGTLRATGDVLVDQLPHMLRCGFNEAVLAPGQNPEVAQRVLQNYQHHTAHYQGDALQTQPLFARNANVNGATATGTPASPASATSSGQAVRVYAKASPTFAAKLAHTQTLLRQAAAQYTPLTQASSLGAEDVVITHLLAQLQLAVDVFVLNTGALHAETLQLLQRTREHSGLQVRVLEPQAEAVVQFVTQQGPQAMYRSIALRKACCHLRKIEPLERALQGYPAWITGLRREQSQARAEVPEVDTSEARVKLNPLADWTTGDVWHYIDQHQVDYNPLHDQFYPSIGCAPCTRAISLGEDFRAGRWWWESEDAKECGLHVPHTQQEGSPV